MRIKVKQRRGPWENWAGVRSPGGRKEVRRLDCLRWWEENSLKRNTAGQRQERWGLKSTHRAHPRYTGSVWRSGGRGGGGWNPMERAEQWEGLARAEASLRSTSAGRQRMNRVVPEGVDWGRGEASLKWRVTRAREDLSWREKEENGAGNRTEVKNEALVKMGKDGIQRLPEEQACKKPCIHFIVLGKKSEGWVPPLGVQRFGVGKWYYCLWLLSPVDHEARSSG